MPHVEPYYDAYAAPYIDLARPYYDAVDQRIITPSWVYAQQYGAPRVQQVQAFAKVQWDRSVQPQVERYQGLARAHYDAKLAPHVDRFSSALGPYYDIARTNGLQTYHGLLVPTYGYIHPFLLEGYRAASAFTGKTVIPSFVWTWNKTYAFLDGTVGPQIRAVYTETVEPQLVKIGKRLGRYSTGKKSVPKPVTDSLTTSSTKTSSSFTKPAASVPATPSVPSASASASAPTHREPKPSADARPRASMEPIPPPEVDEKLEQDDPTRRSAREIVAADLKDWQDRYAKAADEGAAEIDERVQEIAKKLIRRNARITGKSHLDQLQKAASSELDSLRSAILDIIGTSNSGRAAPEEAHEQIIQAVRQAGMAVRDKAQAVRTWRESYEAEMQSSVTQAAETHFTILENIRDLALQKIGMKWAWMDGVTYKDWAKYHLLKSRFDEWKGNLENHVISHPSLEAAQLEAANIEDEAMKLAAAAAKELVRLKQVANWKLTSGDDTPEFDSTLMQQAAEVAEAARVAAASATNGVVGAKDSVKGAIDGAENLVKDALGDAISLASEAASEATDAAPGPEENYLLSETSGPSSEPTIDILVAPKEPLASPTEIHVVDEPTYEPEPKLAAEEGLSDAAEPTSEANPGEDDTLLVASSMILETPVMAGNFTELPGEDHAAPVELPVERDESDLHESSPAKTEDNDTESLTVSDTASVKPALFGAAAQSVPTRQPVLDEDALDEVSAAMESMRGDMELAYSAAVSLADDQYSQALSILSAQIQGTPQPAHEKLLASVTSAYSHAMASARSKFEAAGSFASAGSEEIAREYSSASSAMSELLADKEPAYSKSLIERLRSAYATIQATAASAAKQARETAESSTNKDTPSPARDEL